MVNLNPFVPGRTWVREPADSAFVYIVMTPGEPSLTTATCAHSWLGIELGLMSNPLSVQTSSVSLLMYPNSTRSFCPNKPVRSAWSALRLIQPIMVKALTSFRLRVVAT